MSDAIAERKAALREAVRRQRRALHDHERRALSDAVSQRLLGLPELAGVRCVLTYSASGEEVCPRPAVDALRRDGVRVCLPRVVGPAELELHWVDEASELVTGAYGIEEPAEGSPVAALDEVEAVLVPGIAFDAAGRRLGYGGGFYDALLPRLAATAPRIGVAFDRQVVEEVPATERDAPVDVIVTPTRSLRTGARGSARER